MTAPVSKPPAAAKDKRRAFLPSLYGDEAAIQSSFQT